MNKYNYFSLGMKRYDSKKSWRRRYRIEIEKGAFLIVSVIKPLKKDYLSNYTQFNAYLDSSASLKSFNKSTTAK